VIEDLKPYSETRDSGLPWLGDIPAHWEIKRNGSLFQQRNAVGEPDWPILEVSLRTGVRIREFGSTKRKQVMSDKAKYKCATKGDFVYNMMRMWQGAAGIAPVDGLVSPAYVVAKPLPHTNPAYFASLFRTDDYLAEIDAFSRGIVKDRNRLYWDQFKQIPTPCPPPKEQAAIARFLAWATNRLDRAIGAKRRIIALLQEQKQAIIHRAVTRGLDPAVPLKDSGLPWLGEIPEHWEVRRLKWILRLQRGYDLPAERRKEGNIPVFSSGGHIDNHDIAMADPPGIVLGRYGSTNAAYFIETPYWPHNTALFSTTVFGNNAKWCFYLLQALPKSVHSEKSAVPGVNRRDLFDILAPLAPLAEQAEIAAHVVAATVSLKEAIEVAERDVTLLREYRTRLIADVVTGKLDVREVAAGLPEEVLQVQPDVAARYDADEAEDDAEFDLIDTAED
jgi:type I restriction enzyme S subunit